MARYAVAHLDEIEEFTDAGCHYRPIRHQLGVTAFGDEMSEEFRSSARDDSDLDPIRDDPAFEQLVREQA